MVNNIWQGKLVRLRAVELSDWQSHFVWDQDSEAARLLDRIYFPRSTEKTRQWAETVALRTPENDGIHLQIETLAGELVGSISTHGTDSHMGIFSYGVAVREEFQRKGYASEAIMLVLRYFFHELRYQKATAWVYSFNEGSIRLHEQLGFIREGTLRRMIYTKGQYFDVLVFGMTDEEFNLIKNDFDSDDQ